MPNENNKESQGICLAFLVLVAASLAALTAVYGLNSLAVQCLLGGLYVVCGLGFMAMLVVSQSRVARVRHFWHTLMSIAMLPMAFSLPALMFPHLQQILFLLATLWFIAMVFYHPSHEVATADDMMGAWCNGYHAAMMAAMLWMVPSVTLPPWFHALGWVFLAVMVVGTLGYGRLLFRHQQASGHGIIETALIAFMSLGMTVMLLVML